MQVRDLNLFFWERPSKKIASATTVLGNAVRIIVLNSITLNIIPFDSITLYNATLKNIAPIVRDKIRNLVFCGFHDMLNTKPMNER